MTTPVDKPTTEPSWFLPAQSPALTAAIWGTTKVAAGLQALRGNRCSDGFGILMYHRVAEKQRGVPAPSLNVTPDQFRQQLTGLLQRGFECWSLSKLVAAHDASQPIPANAFAITFDDGYENNYVHAWPILRELGLTGTIFIATKYLDSAERFPFDAWPAAGTERATPSAWRPLTTPQCQEMLDSGVIELGAHTHSHRRFKGRPKEFTEDMKLCLDFMRERLGLVRPTFAFPYGEMDSHLVEAARQMELSCAVTVRQRRVESTDDVFQWGRFFVDQNDTSAMLAAKLSGWYPALMSAGKIVLRQLASVRRVPTRLTRVATRYATNSGKSLPRKAHSH